MPNQPVGPVVDTTPAKRPGDIALDGRYCRVETLDPGNHRADLWHAFKSDDSLWTYLPYGPFADERSFAEWLDGRAALRDPISYVVIESAGGGASGIIAFRNIRLDMRVVEVGHIVYGPALRRSRAGTETHYLLARHAFEQLGFRRYEWRCNALNARSRRAASRLGFTFEGISRQHMIVKGRSRDTAWYAMLDGAWPARRASFERWLTPENFDADGRQRLSLSSLNAADQSESRAVT